MGMTKLFRVSSGGAKKSRVIGKTRDHDGASEFPN